jgi:hypothetical protein
MGEKKMRWNYYLSYFFGGAFLVNALPHFVNGVMGNAFQSPFASPPGEGLSPALTNVFWGTLNFVFAYLLLWRVGKFEMRSTRHFVVAVMGGLLMAIMLAQHFGKFHGGA